MGFILLKVKRVIQIYYFWKNMVDLEKVDSLQLSQVKTKFSFFFILYQNFGLTTSENGINYK